MILKGNPVSPGIALGEIYVYKPFDAHVQPVYFEEGAEAGVKQAFDSAVAKVEEELDAVIAGFGADEEKAKIFVAHKEILYDEEIQEMIADAILQERKMPDFAAFEVFGEFIELLGNAKDELIAARVADFRDVRNRLVRVLHGEKEKSLSRLDGPVIVVAHDLLPSDTATLDRENVLGIITEVGSATSHSAIIANSYRIPAVLGVPMATSTLEDGQSVGLDALTGEIHVQPSERVRGELMAKLGAFLRERYAQDEYLDKPLATADGVRLHAGLNIGSTERIDGYAHADFVGLFRTEFLYMESDHMPGEEEQYEAYKKVLENANGKPVTLRTLDIGGDKTLSYMELPKEDNPFLGNRALRLCLANPAIFRTQLRAALRASAHGELQIMLPMVGSVDDVRRGRAVFDSVRDELAAEGIPVGRDVRFGIMIEIPSVAVIADLVAPLVDFASVGTNDLCQYLCAVDRMSPGLDEYYQPLSPAMARTLHTISNAFNAAGKPLSVCGELAGTVRGALLMAGLGIKKLSMSESNLARVKAAMAQVTMPDLAAAAQRALGLATQDEISAVLTDLLKTSVEEKENNT